MASRQTLLCIFLVLCDFFKLQAATEKKNMTTQKEKKNKKKTQNKVLRGRIKERIPPSTISVSLRVNTPTGFVLGGCFHGDKLRPHPCFVAVVQKMVARMWLKLWNHHHKLRTQGNRGWLHHFHFPFPPVLVSSGSIPSSLVPPSPLCTVVLVLFVFVIQAVLPCLWSEKTAPPESRWTMIMMMDALTEVSLFFLFYFLFWIVCLFVFLPKH